MTAGGERWRGAEEARRGRRPGLADVEEEVGHGVRSSLSGWMCVSLCEWQRRGTRGDEDRAEGGWSEVGGGDRGERRRAGSSAASWRWLCVAAAHREIWGSMGGGSIGLGFRLSGAAGPWRISWAVGLSSPS